MAVIHLSAICMVVFGALFCGGIFFVAVERLNLWSRMSVEQYVIDFRRSLYRLDPLMPILGGLTAVGAVVFAVTTYGPPRILASIVVGLIAIIIAASIVIAEPINSRFRRLPEGQAPDDAERLRVVWRRFHLTRTAFALATLVTLTVATLAV
jgi:hypothetical protein